MRGARSLLILLAVLLGLGAYIYFVESKKPQGDAAETKPKVFAVDADKIAELSVQPAGGERITVRKNGGIWEITEPVAGPADETEVVGITTSLASLENERVVDENPTDLKQYGLAEPRVVVGFKAGGDRDVRRLLIGDKTPTGGEVYAKVGNARNVFLVPAVLESTFNKRPFDLRNKAVLRFERDKVDRVQLQWPGQTIALSLANGQWAIEQPLRAGGDFGTVESVISRIQTVQMKSIVAEQAADLKQYGLDQPEATATLGAGSTQASLLLGKKAEDGTLYAKDASRPMVFTVESSLLDDLKKPVDQLRRKELFDARAYNISSFAVVRGAEIVSVERVKGQGKDADDKWRETKPSSKDLDASKLETYLTKLTNLRADAWVEAGSKTGLDKPIATVTVRSDEGKREEKVSFGRNGAELYASVGGQPGAARVDAAAFDEAMKALDALK